MARDALTTPTAESIAQSYPAALQREHQVLYPYSYYVLGRPSLMLATWSIRLGLSANTVTLISALVSAIGLGLIVWRADYLVGAILLNLGLLLDCADGHIARFQSNSSRFGALADALVAFFTYSLLPLCVGWSLYSAPPEPWLEGLTVEFPREWWLLAGVCRSTCALLTLAVGLQAKLLNKVGYSDTVNRRSLLFVARSIGEGEFFLLLVASLLSAVGILHLAYSVFQLLVLAGVIWVSLGYARSIDKGRGQS